MASQLDYFRERGADHCPDEAKLRQAVKARLGHDPFIEWSPRRVVVEIVADGARLSAILRLVEDGGIVQSRSLLSTDKHDCAELIASVALAIAIHLEPDSAMRVNRGEQAESEQPEEPVAEPAPNPPVLPSPKQPQVARATHLTVSAPKSATPWAPAVRIGAVYLQGLEPHATLALKAGASLRYGHIQAMTELFSGLPDSKRYAAGGIRSHVIGATLLPCVSYQWLSACAEAMADLLWTQGVDVSVPVKATLVHVAVGARVEAAWQLSRTWAAMVGLDLLRNLTSTTLRLQQAELWRSPPYRYAFWLAVEMRFP